MKNALCIVSNTLTTIFAIIALVIANHVELIGNLTLSDIISRADDSKYDMVTPLILMLSFSIIITLSCIVVPLFTKNPLVLNLLLITLSCALIGSSITLLVRSTHTEDLDDQQGIDTTKLSVLKAMLYLAGSFGVLTSVICAAKSTYKLSKVVNKK